MARDSQRSKCYEWDHLMEQTYPFLGATHQKYYHPDDEGPVQDRDQKADAKFLVAYVLADYGIDPSKVKVMFTKRNGGACADGRVINFTPSHISRETIYHELCHVIIRNQPWLLEETEELPEIHLGGGVRVLARTRKKLNPVRQDLGHGPYFVRLLMEVISFYEQIPVVELERLAIQCGLKFVKASEVPQRLPEEQQEVAA